MVCIFEGARPLYFHPDECVDCGACEPVCPVEAIFYEDDVPTQWAPFTDDNARFFTEPLSTWAVGPFGKGAWWTGPLPVVGTRIDAPPFNRWVGSPRRAGCRHRFGRAWPPRPGDWPGWFSFFLSAFR